MAEIIVENDEFGSVKLFTHTVGGYTYNFNVDYLQEYDYDWFCNVVGGKMDDIHNRAVKQTREEIRNNIKQALML